MYAPEMFEFHIHVFSHLLDTVSSTCEQVAGQGIIALGPCHITLVYVSIKIENFQSQLSNQRRIITCFSSSRIRRWAHISISPALTLSKVQRHMGKSIMWTSALRLNKTSLSHLTHFIYCPSLASFHMPWVLLKSAVSPCFVVYTPLHRSLVHRINLG